MEKKVKICDKCDEKLAISICIICGKDLCGMCSYKRKVLSIWSVSICGKCGIKNEDFNSNKKEFWEDCKDLMKIEKQVKAYVKKKVLLNNLDDEKEEDKLNEYKHITLKTNY